MGTKTYKIANSIFMFKGRISRNLIFEPMVSNAYLFEDGEELFIFDPSCGKKIATQIETHIKKRLTQGAKWKKHILIAGHSHMDHANNFYLCDLTNTPDKKIYVHEKGFSNGRVANEPTAHISNIVKELRKYYNPYLGFPFPYNLFMYFFAALDLFSPETARKAFSTIGGLPWPAPKDGITRPEMLKENAKKGISIDGITVKGWKIGSMVVIHTPGHSPCSVSLLWPEKKAIFISDADWFGNPFSISSSFKESISSLEAMKALTQADSIDFLLPAHGEVKEGRKNILCHLDFHIQRLEMLKSEILAGYTGKNTSIKTLAKKLVQQSPVFRLLNLAHYPKAVVIIQAMVAVCLREEGILH